MTWSSDLDKSIYKVMNQFIAIIPLPLDLYLILNLYSILDLHLILDLYLMSPH